MHESFHLISSFLLSFQYEPGVKIMLGELLARQVKKAVDGDA
jgi:hypothetical protein